MKTAIHGLCAAGLALAALVLPASAQAQIHARVESGGFNYMVLDLDKDDGIDAGIRFGAAPAFMVETSGTALLGQRQLVNTMDWKITTVPYSIVHDWIPQIHAGAVYGGGGAAAETTLEPLVDGNVSSSSTVALQPWTFSLAPHTRVSFSMDLTIDMLLDPSLPALEYAGVTGAISLYHQQPDGFWSAPIHDDVGGTIGSASAGDHGSWYSAARTALVSWDNTGDTWVDGQVVNTVGTIAQVTWGPPPVPEPGSWAMLGLGCGLLGAWRRHRKTVA
jgi:hypothetical protein